MQSHGGVGEAEGERAIDNAQDTQRSCEAGPADLEEVKDRGWKEQRPDSETKRSGGSQGEEKTVVACAPGV